MAAIQARSKTQLQLRQLETEWLAKTISQFVIYTIEGEKAQKSLFKVLDQISLVKKKQAPFDPEADTSSSTTKRGFGAEDYAQIEKTGNFEAALERNSRRKGGLGGFGALGVAPS